MAPVSHGDMLKASNQINANLAAQEVKPNPGAKAVKPAPIQELKLVDENEDPFKGNLNNRRVAERIAELPGGVKQYLNNSLPTHIGDPNKAAADVAKSMAITPPTPHDEHLAQAPTEDELKQAAKTNAKNRKAAAEAAASASVAGTAEEPASIGTGSSPTWKPQGA